MLKAYPSTCGAIILGALSASGYDSHSPIEKSPLTLRRHPRLSGIVTAQFVIYLKLFPSDKKSLKGLVRVLAYSGSCTFIIEGTNRCFKVFFVWFESFFILDTGLYSPNDVHLMIQDARSSAHGSYLGSNVGILHSESWRA